MFIVHLYEYKIAIIPLSYAYVKFISDQRHFSSHILFIIRQRLLNPSDKTVSWKMQFA